MSLKKRCSNIHQVIWELDTWMQHYTEWSKWTETFGKEKAVAVEKARNILVETFGEPDPEEKCL